MNEAFSRRGRQFPFEGGSFHEEGGFQVGEAVSMRKAVSMNICVWGGQALKRNAALTALL